MNTRHTALAALLALPLSLAAQPRAPRAPRPLADGPPMGVSPTALLNRRRELDLTPRQVARLDSLERTHVARRRGIADQMRQLRDSACPPQQRCNLGESDRRALRDRMSQLQQRGVDTTMSRQALSVLDSTQRGRVQGMRMGRAGRRLAMQRGANGPRGFGPGGGRMDRPRTQQFRGYGPPARGRVPGRYMDAPRGRGYIDAPRARRFMDGPGARQFMDASRARQFMDAPRARRFMDGPQGRRFMDGPQGRRFMDMPQGPRGMAPDDAPQRPRRPMPPMRRGADSLTTPAPRDTTI